MSMRKLFIGLVTLLVAVNWANGQTITAERSKVVKQYEGESDRARVDFISESTNLKFEENNGETVQDPQKRADNKYMYTCICDLTDKNKLGFNISMQGGAETQLVTLYIEEAQWLEYIIDIEEIPVSISEIKVTNPQVVIPIDNTASVLITSTYNRLNIVSSTGEKVEGPTVNNKNSFDYKVNYDLSTSQSREVQRSISISAGKNEKPLVHSLGTLSPKQGVDLAVIVINETCYANQTNYAKQSFLNGLYRESYETYKKLIETNECMEKPSDLSKLKEDMSKMRTLAAAFLLANNYYAKAESFEAEGLLDSCIHYQGEAYKYRNLILKTNPSDPYCLEYNRKYDLYKMNTPRVVTGKVVNNVRMDANENNLPLEGIYIILSKHKRGTKKVNGVNVPAPGDEIEGERQNLAQSAADGSFSVSVPRNNKNIMYVLHFTADASFSKKSYSIDFVPNDDLKPKPLVIKMTPKSLNEYNK